MTTKTKKPWHVRCAIHELRVNVKSLAAEARIIRLEERKVRDDSILGMMHGHRVHHVRNESRIAQLALACVRGVPYRMVENSTRNPVSVSDLRKKLNRFMAGLVTEEFVEGWLTK